MLHYIFNGFHTEKLMKQLVLGPEPGWVKSGLSQAKLVIRLPQAWLVTLRKYTLKLNNLATQAKPELGWASLSKREIDLTRLGSR